MDKQKYLLTKSKDNCVIIIKAKKKTEQTDVFISNSTFKKNIESNTFVKHENLTYNDNPIYIYHEDL
tara:strand:- start:141 stop:341 length:201 start_codon:yes stop_codon:yes gene_type:complete